MGGPLAVAGSFFLDKLGFVDPRNLVHHPFRDDLPLWGEGGRCWSAHMYTHHPSCSGYPVVLSLTMRWAAPASLPEAELLAQNNALCLTVSCLYSRPQDAPDTH